MNGENATYVQGIDSLKRQVATYYALCVKGTGVYMCPKTQG